MRREKLPATSAEVLNNMVRPRLRRLRNAAERRKDRQTRGEMQPQRKPPQRMRGRPPKLQLGTAPQERRTDLLLIRGRAEAGGQEPSALPLRPSRRLRTLHGPLANSSNSSTRGETVCR